MFTVALHSFSSHSDRKVKGLNVKNRTMLHTLARQYVHWSKVWPCSVSQELSASILNPTNSQLLESSCIKDLKRAIFKLHGQRWTKLLHAALLTFNRQSSQKYSNDSLLYGRLLIVNHSPSQSARGVSYFQLHCLPVLFESADMNIHDNGPPLNHNKSVTMPLQEVFPGTEIRPDLHTISAFNFP